MHFLIPIPVPHDCHAQAPCRNPFSLCVLDVPLSAILSSLPAGTGTNPPSHWIFADSSNSKQLIVIIRFTASHLWLHVMSFHQAGGMVSGPLWTLYVDAYRLHKYVWMGATLLSAVPIALLPSMRTFPALLAATLAAAMVCTLSFQK